MELHISASAFGTGFGHLFWEREPWWEGYWWGRCAPRSCWVIERKRMAHVWKGFAGVNAFTNRSIAWRTGTTAGLASALLAATVCTGKLLCALLFFFVWAEGSCLQNVYTIASAGSGGSGRRRREWWMVGEYIQFYVSIIKWIYTFFPTGH